MQKYLDKSIYYALFAMASGVFYREFTKVMKFEGRTYLSKVHPHVFVLGMLFYLIIYLLSFNLDFEKNPKIDKDLIYYNFGLILSIIMMMTRGIIQILYVNLTNFQNATISGLAGLGHTILALSIILSFFELRKKKKID